MEITVIKKFTSNMNGKQIRFNDKLLKLAEMEDLQEVKVTVKKNKILIERNDG